MRVKKPNFVSGIPVDCLLVTQAEKKKSKGSFCKEEGELSRAIIVFLSLGEMKQSGPAATRTHSIAATKGEMRRERERG